MEWHTVRSIWFWNGIKNKLEHRNKACSNCLIEKRSKNAEKPVLPIELLEFSPGEYLTSDRFELDKFKYITITDKLLGLILGST